MKSVRIICFSPTGGTRAILKAIADGFGAKDIVMSDLTLSCNRRDCAVSPLEDVAIIGVPVYAERVPAIASKFLAQVKGRDLNGL